VPKLFVVRTTDEDEAPPAKKKKVAPAEKKPKKAASRPRPSLFEANDAQRAAENQATEEVVTSVDQHIEDPDETRAIPWSPRLASASTTADEADEGEAPVFGRLLGRAFGQRAPEE
jgi:hypothetical protein